MVPRMAQVGGSGVKQVIERWTKGQWRCVGEMATKLEAECAVKGLNEQGELDYQFREVGKR